MFLLTNTQQIQTTASLPDAPVNSAMRHAANDTGVSFDYLMKTAKRESNLNPAAQASTSSASGLYQFLDQTWLSTIKTDGAKFGLAKEATQIVQSKSGFLSVPDSAMRQKILDLRNDPAVSSQVAAAFTLKNQAQLVANLGRAPSEGELYIAHFLGANGASDFIRLASENPDSNAATAFPDAASANHSVFYSKSNHAKSIAEVYSALVMQFSVQALEPTPRSSDMPLLTSANNTMYRAKEGGKPLLSLFHVDEGGPVAEPIQRAWRGLGGNAYATGDKSLNVPAKSSFQPPLNLLSFINQN